MAYTDNFPQRPVFQADFANGGRIDPRATFSRADTPPTYAAPSAVHFWSNEKHLSSENLTTNSDDLSDWGRIYMTRTLSQVGPDGSSNAAKLTGQAGTVFKAIYNATLANTSAQTISFFAKEDTHRYIQVSVNGDATKFVNFDLNGSGAYSANGTGVTASITPSANGFVRCAVNLTLPNTSAYISLQDSLSAAREATTASTGSIYIFGAMATTLGDATNVVAYQSSGSQISRSYAPTLKSVATAGQPRFEYDPTDGQSMGVLIESQATNLVTYSSDITQSFFTGFRSTQESNVAVGPDGTLTADLLREDSTTGNSHGVYFEYASGGTTAQTISVYAKAAGRNHLSFRFDTTNGVFGSDFVWFNLSTGAVGTTDSDITASIESCGNGWYRCISTRTALASANGRIVLYLADADNSTSYDGDSYSGVLLWGIQAEANASHASSLVSTSGASATRAADSLSVATADLGIASGQDLTVIVDGVAEQKAGAALLGFDDGTSSNYARILRHSSNNYTFDVRTNATSQAVITAPNSSSDTKFAFRLEQNNLGAVAGGGSVNTDTSATLGLTNIMQIGNAYWGVQANGHIKRVALYGEALSDTNLQALTS